MKRAGLFVIILFVLSTLTVFAQEKKSSSEPVKEVKTEKLNEVCPVSKEPIEDNSITHEYKGKTYALCCKSCLKKFKADPEKYVSKLENKKTQIPKE